MRYRNVSSTILAVLFVSVLCFLFVPPVIEKFSSLGSGSGPAKTYYDVIGTVDAPVNLSTTFASTTGSFLATNLETLSLNIRYASAVSTTNYLSLLVEVSNDNGTTYYPLVNKVANTTNTLGYIEDASGNVGVPILFPGDQTLSTSTVYYGSVTFTDVVADYVRVSAKSLYSATTTLAVRAIVTSK